MGLMVRPRKSQANSHFLFPSLPIELGALIYLTCWCSNPIVSPSRDTHHTLLAQAHSICCPPTHTESPPPPKTFALIFHEPQPYRNRMVFRQFGQSLSISPHWNQIRFPSDFWFHGWVTVRGCSAGETLKVQWGFKSVVVLRRKWHLVVQIGCCWRGDHRSRRSLAGAW